MRNGIDVRPDPLRASDPPLGDGLAPFVGCRVTPVGARLPRSTLRPKLYRERGAIICIDANWENHID